MYSDLDKKIGTNRKIEVFRMTDAIRISDSKIEIHYKNYPIVTLYSDGDILVDNGGMMNRAVKDRMNLFIPKEYKIEINYGNWFIYRNRKVFRYINPEVITI
jgi:hypothetical protein